MDLGLKDRVALVAASSKGIGKAIANGLAAEGTRLSLCARGAEKLDATAQELRAAHGVDVLATAADVSRPADVQRVVDATLAHFGRIDILVCNAGGPPAGQFMDFLDDAAWDKAFQQNLMSAVRLSRLVIPGMRQRHWGRIITVTSLAAKEPIPNLILSNVMRAGVVGMVKTLSRELAPDGILVTNVMPGMVLTDRITSLAAGDAKKAGRTVEELVAEYGREIPLGRLASPAEFAEMVVFLASERAGYVTGVSISIDGGSMKSLM